MAKVTRLPIGKTTRMIKVLTALAVVKKTADLYRLQGITPGLKLDSQVSNPIFTLNSSAIQLQNILRGSSQAEGVNGAEGTSGVDGADGGKPPSNPIDRLEKMGLRNITKEAREGELDPVFERSDEMAELSRRLKGGSNALLIGNTGVGKTAIVEGLAQEWKGEENVCFFSLGMKDLDRNVLEPQLKAIIETVQEGFRQGYEIYILMDELHLFEQAGILELLKEPLARPGFQVVGATTTDEYYRYFNNAATKRRFGDPIFIQALTGNRLRRLVRNIIPVILERLKGSEKIVVPPRSRQTAIELSPLAVGRFPPDATIALLKDAIGTKRSQLGDLKRVLSEIPQQLTDDLNDLMEYESDAMHTEVAGIWKSVIGIVSHYLENEVMLARVEEELTRTGKLTITESDVRTEASKMAGLDLRRLDQLDVQQLSQIETRIRTRFIGQDQAVKAIAGAIKRYKSGRRKKKSPIASFLFTGPTGIGKTELAHTLAWLLFGNPDKVMTIDMTKCNGRGGKALLFGPDPGFVGFDSTEGMLPGLLKRKENRHGVLFFDEADKADREVYESLLVMLDQGYVQNKKTGEKYSLEDIVVIMASNQGETQMLKPAQMKKMAEDHIRAKENELREQLEETNSKWKTTKGLNDETDAQYQAMIQKLEKELAEIKANRSTLKNEIIEKLIEENRKIAGNSFRNQTDEYEREKYSPAFLNRLEIIPFDYLNEAELSIIADIMFKNFVAQVEKDQKLEIILGENQAEYEAIKQYIMAKGTDLSNGARPLKRAIEDHLDNPFSAWLIEALPSGEYIIKVSLKDGKPLFEETQTKSERGKQMDIAHLRGRKGTILRRLSELAKKDEEIEASAISNILAP
ncbi:MAG: AAA family ATPase, partial [Candidatus Margulisiibacteriota bacterium]